MDVEERKCEATERPGARPTSWACDQSGDQATVAAATDTCLDSGTAASLAYKTTSYVQYSVQNIQGVL